MVLKKWIFNFVVPLANDYWLVLWSLPFTKHVLANIFYLISFTQLHWWSWIEIWSLGQFKVWIKVFWEVSKIKVFWSIRKIQGMWSLYNAFLNLLLIAIWTTKIYKVSFGALRMFLTQQEYECMKTTYICFLVY